MKETDAAKTLLQFCRRLYDKGFLPGKDGNLSVRAGDTVLITPTGVPKYAVTEENVVRMGLDGNVLGGGAPSSEAGMHLAVYRQRSDAGAVIHAHSPLIGAFVLAEKLIDTRCAPFAYMHLGIIGEVPYIAPGSAQLHNAVEEAVQKGGSAFMLMKHGSLVIGSSLEDAFLRLDLMESFAGMLAGAKMLGDSRPLSEEELKGITHG